jgi:glycerol-3-phosphate dehydrogenase
MDTFPSAETLRQSTITYGDELRYQRQQENEQKRRQEKLNALLKLCEKKIEDARLNLRVAFSIPQEGHSKQSLMDLASFLKTKGYTVSFDDKNMLVRWADKRPLPRQTQDGYEY